MKPAPNLVCPVCGGPNGCAPAASGTFDTPCWCASVKMPPPTAKADDGKAACLCFRCATRSMEER